MHALRTLTVLGAAVCSASAITIAEINGDKFISPLNGQAVSDVSGLVTFKGPNGFWMRSTKPDKDSKTSESIYVFGDSGLHSVEIGDIISLNGEVDEYRSSDAYLYLTEITSPSEITVVSSNNKVTPRVLGSKGYKPPTRQYTSLDDGDIFGVPNNVSQISVDNPTLQPKLYGLDFWESINGELVTIKSPRALGRPNNYGEFWIAGSYRTTGNNDRDALTATDGDANPEGILLDSPVDDTDHPDDIKLGDHFEDITCVITYQFGFFYCIPQTAVSYTSRLDPYRPAATKLTSKNSCKGITIGQYNVENLSPSSATLDDIANQIVTYLRTPDLIFLQEVQDNNGATDDDVVSANTTLSDLVSAINAAGCTVHYAFTDIPPVDDTNGGQPGGNIRNAYLYNPSVLRLRNPNPAGSTDAEVLLDNAELKYNPGLIDPTNPAWSNSRKPLVAAWETLDSQNKFFTINVHWTSKGGSSSLQGDPRPPINGGLAERIAQANVTATFIASLLSADEDAAVISAGDFNEFAWVRPLTLFQEVSELSDLDEVVGIREVERYTYTFGVNTQQLDHMYVSPRLAKGGEEKGKGQGKAEFEHVHVSSWVSERDVVSDHDPSVARFDVCA
ncbi:DNase I-like protein [Hortaea werneckii]|nr:DNase I-like protein [Hortaea werneckii]KAI7717935.1 DNase I-like protein [Hortaea werneckii]